MAAEAAKHRYVDIIMRGGRLFLHSMVNVETAVIDSASRLRAEIYALRVGGVRVN